ncbi:type II secretion system minor pseudopilin GspK [Sphaerotilus uruguayifluvii]|uniref:Type II secretion system protein K n=1 Tax=Sphaerotilus uruguayifluvii TaxID=2735897 RepID=A0ABX2G4G7_9BURK|nr:type II secretion system minor pseudopilin GspK [Leptothrix sp. C29]NRT56905.1 general secretion pathway protein K [Leptothrix sp. C29]
MRMPLSSGRRPPAQRGAALLTAMILVTVVATLAAGMLWQQWRALQVESAERVQTQAQWLLQGALDWSRMILREDARSGGTDHLNEPWAAPLAEARLSTFLAADSKMAEGMPDAFLSGRIEDAQSRYNLRNLVQQGKVSPPELQTLTRLCEYLGLGGDVAQRLALALRRATPGGATETETGSVENGSALPLMPPSADELGWLGLSEPVVRTLRPYVVLLPRETPVNLNTAPKEVIAAVLPGTDLAGAQRLVQARLREPLRSPDDAKRVLGERALTDARRVSVNSSFFVVSGVLRLDALVIAQRSLIERQGREVRLLSTRRLTDPRELQAALQP